ncbi:MAG: DUF2760 domain-containing protein [Deltaproteobacteria bacterium]|nr:DUF2760 domain-containing protein [Deltaproteobacteria bacterium]
MSKPTLRPLAYVLILLLTGAAATGSYILFTQASFGPCSIGALVRATSDVVPVGQQPACQSYLYAFAGAPLVAGLLLLLIVPSLVTSGEEAPFAQAIKTPGESKKAAPPPAPPKSTTDAAVQHRTPTGLSGYVGLSPKPTTEGAVQLLSLFQREGRLVDFLREDIQSYDDAQVGAAVRTIHQSCREVLAEHLTLEPVLNGNEGDDITVPKDFDPSAIRLTGNVTGEPPFRGALRHAGWRANKVKLPAQPAGQDPQIVAPAEVEIP